MDSPDPQRLATGVRHRPSAPESVLSAFFPAHLDEPPGAQVHQMIASMSSTSGMDSWLYILRGVAPVSKLRNPDGDDESLASYRNIPVVHSSFQSRALLATDLWIVGSDDLIQAAVDRWLAEPAGSVEL